jgi:signal transduction histidine kinase
MIFGNLDYDTFTQQVLAELQSEVQLRKSSLQVEGPTPKIKLPFDPKRLRRVFYNIVYNALDVMPGGGHIHVRFRPAATELVTEISDTGPGIAREIADQLFQPFTTFGKPHGTGLGLSICRRIIEDHRRHIWARSEPGHGAVFAFSLPLTQ